MKATPKTNAMRILESMKIPFSSYTYECDEFVDAIQIADMLKLPYEKVYKTLVAQGHSREYYVFVIPIAEELEYVTRIDRSAEALPAMIVSGGRLGMQIELKPEDLRRAAKAEFADIVFQREE